MLTAKILGFKILAKSPKGFIGPIGDDLPSLIPLLFALIIFFSTFSYAISITTAKNAALDSDLALLKVARVLRSNGYITDRENFGILCKTVNIRSINYKAGLVETRITVGKSYKGLDIFDLKFFDDTPETDGDNPDSLYVCTNADEDIELEELSGMTIASKIFPVVLEHNNRAKPMFLVVIAWQR